jgi:hypothetical protein
LGKLEELLGTDLLKQEWQKRREAMLSEWVDPTDVFWEELCRFTGRFTG